MAAAICKFLDVLHGAILPFLQLGLGSTILLDIIPLTTVPSTESTCSLS